MRVQRLLGVAVTSLALALLSSPLAAQQGLLTGHIVDADSGQPIDAAQVQVLGGGQSTGGLTDASGAYRIQLAPGSYSIVVVVVGYRPERFDGLSVTANQTTVHDISLVSMAMELDGVVVSASRGMGEKATEAPATTFTISSVQISERPVASPVEYLRSAPGVDIITEGLQASNVVVRGFNNIFSGALHMLSDYRLAGVPSLRVNLMHFIPSNEQDIDRMEVVLGPGAALYGPNTANGVVHILTKSPLQSQGTTVTLGGGQRNVFQGSFRSAFLLNEDLGFKVSGQYLRGDEWEFNDPTELANRAAADANPTRCLNDKLIRGVSPAGAQEACGRIGIRDYETERFGLEARADWRFADNGTFVGTYGRNNSTGIELTGLGAGQTVDWVYEFYQARMNIDRFFAQAYLNTSDAGDSYLLNSGVPLVDKSRLMVGQIQHGFSLADGRQDFTYGFDYLGTRPRTEGNINGTYEDDDNMNEWGVYLQSKTSLSEKVDLIFAGRSDDHSVLADKVFSPRAAIVFRPVPEQSLRFSFNRAYSSPSSLNYFLDISNGLAPGAAGSLGFGLRAFGTGRNGWTLTNADGSLKGFRSPFNPAAAGGSSQTLPMGATTAFWPATIQVLQAQVQAGALPASLAPLLPILAGLTPTPGSIGTMLLDPVSLQLTPLASANLPGVPSIGESNSESFEIGWTGIIDQRFKISADIYRTTQNNFVSPLLVQTPLVTFNGQDVGAFISGPLGPILVQAGMAQGLTLQQAQAAAQQTITALATGIASVPIGVVSAPEISGGSDIIVSYRNVGDLTLWGQDVAFQWFLDDNWMLNGSYSHVSDDLFEIDDGAPIALNAPTHKGSLSLAYRNLSKGFNTEARFRFNNSFHAVSAGFEGVVPESKIVDLTVGLRVPNTAATLQLAVTNLFNAENKSFVGVPDIGRFLLLRMRYDLF
ncbi:MAG TPA: TonB-dependent receptor [Longimicrobiales bacterium]|nr:TonB-dependent receptor [Longimicrobiales bacterium]